MVEGDKILLCRLGRYSNDPGVWTLPGGGMEFGEHPEETLVREVREETGYQVEAGRLLKIDSRTFSVERGDAADGHSLRFFYTVRRTGGGLRDEPKGSTDRARWIPLHEVERLPHADIVALAMALVREHEL